MFASFLPRFRYALLLAALSLGSATCAAAADADKAPAGQKYALLVGVKSYIPTELKKLNYTENDVTELAAALTAGGYAADHVRLLTQAAAENNPELLPTGKNIAAALKEFAGQCRPGDSLLVAFAGHGVQYQSSDESYFCPMDAKLADKATLLPFGEVGRQLEQCKASFKLLLVDACRNDPLADTRSVSSLKLESVTRPQEKLRPGGTAILFSCSAGEKAFEDPELKHGVFFHFVIQGLRGDADLDQDGSVVLPELEVYTKKHVHQYVSDKFQTEQMPDLVAKTAAGLVPLVSVSRERASLSTFVESANAFAAAGYVHLIAHAVSDDGKTAVLVGQGADYTTTYLSIWDVPSKKEIAKLSDATGGPPVALSADGKWAAHNFTDLSRQGLLKVYDLAAGAVKTQFKGVDSGPLAFAADGSLLWLDLNHDLRRLDVAAGVVPVFPKGERLISSVVALSADGATFARAAGGKLEVWDTVRGQLLSRSAWPAAEEALQQAFSLCLSPDGKSLVQDHFGKGTVSVWDTASGQERCTIATAAASFAKTAFCSDGKTVAVKYNDEYEEGKDTTHLKFYDLATGKERPNATPLARVFDFALSRDGAKMLTVHQKSKNEWLVQVGDLPASVRKK